MQETPYSFHEPGEFSCEPNRGAAGNSLFLVNHWIETSPAPLPSNAEIVNAYDFLLARAKRCQKERGRLPNLIAVDFYKTGDVVRVAATLNGLAAELPSQGKNALKTVVHEAENPSIIASEAEQSIRTGCIKRSNSMRVFSIVVVSMLWILILQVAGVQQRLQSFRARWIPSA